MDSKEKKAFLRSGFFSFGQRYSSILFGFGTFFFLVRLYPKSEFGIWALFTAITAVVEVARNGFIRNAKIRFLNFEEGKSAEINTASFLLNIIFSLLTCLVLVITGPFLARLWDIPEITEMLQFYLLTVLIMTFNSQFEYLLFAHKNFKATFLGTSARFGILFSFVISCFILSIKPELNTLIIIQAGSAFISSILLYYFAKKHFEYTTKPDWNWVKNLVRFGRFTFATNVSSMLNRYVDQAMVGAMISPAAVAIYNAAIRVSTLIEAPTLAIASIVFPETAKKIKSEGKEAVCDLYEKSVAAIMAITLPALIIGIVFPEQVILIIAGEAYLDSVPVLQITILYSFFIPFARQFGTIFDSIGKPKLNFYFVLANAVLNLIFNYIFISAFGLTGAAYGSLAAYFIVFIFNQIILYKELQVSTLRTIKYTFTVYSKLFSTTRTMVLKQFS